jgi:hypothetical protein
MDPAIIDKINLDNMLLAWYELNFNLCLGKSLIIIWENPKSAAITTKADNEKPKLKIPKSDTVSILANTKNTALPVYNCNIDVPVDHNIFFETVDIV